MIGVDGGQGLIAALPIVCHTIPVQRGGAHTIRTILNKVRVADQQAVKADVHAVMNAPNCRKAASPTPGKMPTPRPSPACATISTTCSPAYAKTLAEQRQVSTAQCH